MFYIISHCVKFRVLISILTPTCILKQKGICEFPTEDCSHISGNIIRIPQIITTSDVRVIKWLTGYTVDANFFESPKISEDWVKDKSLLLRRK